MPIESFVTKVSLDLFFFVLLRNTAILSTKKISGRFLPLGCRCPCILTGKPFTIMAFILALPWRVFVKSGKTVIKGLWRIICMDSPARHKGDRVQILGICSKSHMPKECSWYILDTGCQTVYPIHLKVISTLCHWLSTAKKRSDFAFEGTFCTMWRYFWLPQPGKRTLLWAEK